MSSATAPRLMLRRTGFVGRQPTRRYASTQETASNATSKAKDTASNVQSKASEGLSKVTSSAGPAISNAAESASKAIGNIGGRTGRIISSIQSLVPPTVYYSRVGLEMAKIIVRGQRMNPPNAATFQQYWQPIISAIRSPSLIMQRFQPENMQHILNSIRNMNRQQWATYGVVGAEVLGFFTIGEMIGKRKIVGYRGDPHNNGDH